MVIESDDLTTAPEEDEPLSMALGQPSLMEEFGFEASGDTGWREKVEERVPMFLLHQAAS